MDAIYFSNYKERFSNTLKVEIQNQNPGLWKFWLYYLFKKNKVLKQNQIGEIEEFLDTIEIPRKDYQLLDEDIVTFFIGYNILLELNPHTPFRPKFEEVKAELENHWNSKNELYFNNEVFTCMIYLFDKENVHKNNVDKFKKSNHCSIILLICMILDAENRNEELDELYNSFLNRVNKKYYTLRDPEKIYVAWILWKFRNLSKLKIKEVREIVINYISINDEVINEINTHNINLKISIYYDLLTDFQENTIVAKEEVPITYRILAGFCGLILILFSVYFIQYNQGLNIVNESYWIKKIIHVFLLSSSFVLLIIGSFLIYEIVYKQTYTDEELFVSLKKWINKYIIGAFIVGGILVSFFINKF
ncbi:MAG: hypothetical protein KO318_04970 [Methanobacterium sp.]|jgi:hypothetical protein|uniref:hypothetical protein n=1 Tax=Methanobacterium sp. TaxID=2164 RepID=UPI00258BD01A|nr:hypothetical protein [Methanobacterium sp.]MCC7559766.1 hypothetical protein [Methanobacterium sp.]